MIKMGLLNRETDKIPVHDALIYKKFEMWSGKSQKDELKALKKKIEKADGTYKKELQKIYRKKDFLRIFIIMCVLTRQNFGAGKEKDILREFTMGVIGCVIGDMILETNNIRELNEILFDLEKRHPDEFRRCVDDRREGQVWIMDHKSITETIDNVLQDLKGENMEEIPEGWGITFEDYARYDFAMFSGLSVTEVESMLARGISRIYLRNLLYGFIMRRILMDALGDDLYLTWYNDEDLFTGHSGVNHFFNGIIILEDKDRENPWLLKCISTYYNSLDAIESIDAKLGDIGVSKCILFVPMYPSQNALRYCGDRFIQMRQEIIMLYLHDLYEMSGIVDDDGIKEYLMERRIR